MPEETKQIIFRLTLDEYKECERIASITSHAGQIRNDSVASLAKACLFTRINEWKKIEAMQKAIMSLIHQRSSLRHIYSLIW